MTKELLPDAAVVVDEPEGFAPSGPPFLWVERRRLRVRFPDGALSDPFPYDCVLRARLDAVVVVPHFVEGGARHVVFRTCLRPPAILRPAEQRPFEEPAWAGHLLELPAGLVEPDERSADGLRACAARELEEETGFVARPEALRPLGPSGFPAPGMTGERHHFFEVELDPSARALAASDGSALEHAGRTVVLRLDDALARMRRGELEDEKTELGLRRLEDRYAR